MSQDLDTLIDRRRLKRRLRFWRTAAVIALIVVAWILIPIGRIERGPYVARVSVNNLIVENPALESVLDDIARDSDAKALIVRIDSPGGTTAGSEALFHAIRRVGKAKPVVAVMGTLAASGGYITAIAADHLIARETTLTGSIGVIFQTAEFANLLKKVGVGVETVRSGPLKGEPAIDKPMSDKARAALQGMIDDSYNWFVDLVAKRRGMPRKDVLALADGRVYTGRQAIANGLVDELGGEHQARAWLESKHGIPSTLPVIDKDQTARARLLTGIVGMAAQKILSTEDLTLDGMVSLWHPMR